MQVRKAVERRRFAIQAIFSLLTNSYVVGFLTGTHSQEVRLSRFVFRV